MMEGHLGNDWHHEIKIIQSRQCFNPGSAAASRQGDESEVVVVPELRSTKVSGDPRGPHTAPLLNPCRTQLGLWCLGGGEASDDRHRLTRSCTTEET